MLSAEEDKPQWVQEQLSGFSYTVPADQKGLTEGEYLLLLETMAGKSSASKEIELLVVGTDELPEKARKLLALKLDERLQARLLINILHKHDNWRFYAA